MSLASGASDFSVALLGELIQLGVGDVVLAPGSRSQALALAAAEYERVGAIRLSVRIDERDAGFLALGLAMETGRPVAIITTSGTAVANLHPAVLEAHHAGVPLILLTADRPAELRGIGTNQTTNQLGIFADAVRVLRDVQAPAAGKFDAGEVRELAREAYSAAAGHSSAPGPAQLNVGFREPLSGAIGDLPVLEPHPLPAVRTAEPFLIEPRYGTVVVAGAGAGERAEEVARALGAPLLAEVASGARFGPNLVVAYRELLDDEAFGGQVSRVVVFGHPTLSRQVPALSAREEVETIVVRGSSGEDYNPAHRARHIVDAIRVGDGAPLDRSWAGSWVAASRALLDDGVTSEPVNARTDDRAAVAEFGRAQLAVFRQPVDRRMLVDAVWKATWPHDRLVFGASRLIREADRRVTGKKIRVLSNRGLSGIDGTISTAVGVAVASQGGADAGGVTRVVLGDLTFLHDVGGLLFGFGEDRPRIQLIVGNDGGGTIFDALEVAQTAPAPDIDRVLYTPQRVDIESLARAYGWEYVHAPNRGELDEALTASATPRIIEVPLPRA